MSGWLSAFGFILSYGPVYVGFAVHLTFHLRGRDETYCLWMLARAPAVFSMFFALLGTAYNMTQTTLRVGELLLSVLFLLSGALIIGYAFAGGIYLLYRLLRMLGVVRLPRELEVAVRSAQ